MWLQLSASVRVSGKVYFCSSNSYTAMLYRKIEAPLREYLPVYYTPFLS